MAVQVLDAVLTSSAMSVLLVQILHTFERLLRKTQSGVQSSSVWRLLSKAIMTPFLKLMLHFEVRTICSAPSHLSSIYFVLFVHFSVSRFGSYVYLQTTAVSGL